jgi:hypothetical protein
VAAAAAELTQDQEAEDLLETSEEPLVDQA